MRKPVLTVVLTALSVTLVAQTPKKHFLWAVKAEGAPPIYLMGSLHDRRPSMLRRQ